jgi:EpsI family protein
MIVRTGILSAFLLLCAAYLALASKPDRVPPRTSLLAFPFQMGPWTGVSLPDFDQKILALLGADEYVNRAYATERDEYVGLYLAYYGGQRQGDTIHSPLNCLPGAGWQPVSHSYLTIPIGKSHSITVNRYIIQKGLDRQVVLYWYQSQGRVVANEYWSKLYMMRDAIRLNRTDAALVRVTARVVGSDPTAESAASRSAVEFVQELFPRLHRYLPV